MRKFLHLLLCGAFLTGCVDRDYDLSDIDTDNVTIGSEESEFRIPLATVRVGMADLAENGTDIRAIFDEADIWLPSTLDGDCVRIQRLIDDAAYLDGLLDDLTAEMLASDAKLRSVTDLVWDKYRATFLPLIPGITGDETADQFYEAFEAAFRGESEVRDLLSDQIRTVARDYLSDLRVDDLSYNVERIDLSSDMVDMLAKNLDPKGTKEAKNTLHLYGEIRSKLPVSLHLSPRFLPTDVQCEVTVDALEASNPIVPTQLFEDDLRQIVDGMTIRIPVTLQLYYPGKGFDDTTSEPQILIDLRLVKKGGLTLDL